MSEASQRVEAWRQAQRQAGRHRVVAWLSFEETSELDALKYTLGLDRSKTIAAAIRALAVNKGVSKPLKMAGCN
jgi:hypothetical protein